MANTLTGYDEYSVAQRAIDRRQRMADLLSQKALHPIESAQTVGGIPSANSWTQVLAKMLEGAQSGYDQRGIAGEEKALGEKYKTDLSSTLSRALAAGSGSPERPMQFDPQEISQAADQGMPTPSGTMPAQAPDRQAMASILMSHPGTQALGQAELMKEMENKRAMSVLAGLGVGSPSATSGQALGAELASGGKAGPTTAAAGRIGASNSGLSVDPVTTQLLLGAQGNPSLTKLAEFQNANRNPHAVTEGGALVDANGSLIYSRAKLGEGINPTKVGPTGQVMGVEAIPGYVAAHGQIKGAEQQAIADNAIETFEVGGRKVSMTRAQAKALFTGTAPNEAAAISANRAGTIQGINVPQIGLAEAPLAGTPVRSGMQNPTAAEQHYDTKKAESFAEMSQKMRSSWESANKMNGMLDHLDLLYQDPNVTKGAAAENISGLKGIAASLNVDIAGKGTEDAIQSITNKFALELRNPSGGAGMPGAMSDGDRTFLSSIPPGLSKTPAGRALISNGMRAVNNRDKQVADMAQQYEEKNGRLDMGFVREMRAWSNKNPMFDEQQKAIMRELIKRGG